MPEGCGGPSKLHWTCMNLFSNVWFHQWLSMVSSPPCRLAQTQLPSGRRIGNSWKNISGLPAVRGPKESKFLRLLGSLQLGRRIWKNEQNKHIIYCMIWTWFCVFKHHDQVAPKTAWNPNRAVLQGGKNRHPFHAHFYMQIVPDRNRPRTNCVMKAISASELYERVRTER